jgi:nicotinate-nucleotide--dimethylbenzimidazole phosphoribosyltransferase
MTVSDKPSVLEGQLRARIAGKAKPVGSLGRLEDLAVQIGLLAGSLTPDLGLPRLVVFVGDHGLTCEGIAAFPSDVTRQIAKLVLTKSAGASVTAAAVGTDVVVVDAGLLVPLDDQPGLISKRIGAGTKNSRREAAMSLADYQRAFDGGQEVVAQLIAEGVGIFALGEIGIGNSSSATLLAHAATDIPIANLIGPGAGLPPKGLDHKRAILIETYGRAFKDQLDCEPRRAFVELAGFEMVMMAGAISAISKAKKIAIIDGFIATSVAAALFAIDPKARDACVFAHVSAEPGHKALLAWLKVTPLFDLGLRLGEGTGAVLAVPFVRAAVGLLTQLADLPSVHAIMPVSAAVRPTA